MKPGLLGRFIELFESGEKSARELTEYCLDQIVLSDSNLHAWVEVDPQPPLSSGALDAIPFGAKDIFETTELGTRYGSSLFAGRKGDTEAGLITSLRQRGAVLLGKTHTAAFAYYDPPPTRNPLNPAHTPGGSSSGSAAAVAAGMVPFSLGTQTQGSILRPASYCGICGFKPTYGLLPTSGILPFAPSFDTPGLFTQTAEDMHLLWQRLGNPINIVAPRRLGSVQGPAPPLPGWLVDDIELPFKLNDILLSVQLINAYEGARTHRDLWLQHGDRLGPKLSQLVCDGLKIADGAYETALGTLAYARTSIADVYREYPVLVSPAATGPAPLGLESTGDPRMNAPWTGLHGPAIAIPVPGAGLPVGLQLTAAIGNDDLLVETARLVEAALQHTSNARQIADRA
jgi:Asp-tRNA(Asn)/Glu-tRNA(Gln) amidotransferase A subunit family amidase